LTKKKNSTRTNTFPFILHDLGYDVWLFNFRGNRYSRKNTIYSPDDEKFWTFSIDDIIEKDLPAMLNYAAKTSNPNNPSIRAYIGHSQGSSHI